MTFPTDPTPDDTVPNASTDKASVDKTSSEKSAAKSTALAAVPVSGGVDPFTPRPDETVVPRGVRTRLLDYSAHAAMIVGLVGFAWTVGAHVVHRPAASADAPASVAVRHAPTDQMTELQSRNNALADSVRSLQARLDALQASLDDQGKVAAQVRVLQAGLDTVKSGLGTARSEQASAVARLDGKIDKIGHEPASKMQQLVDRLGKLERSSVDAAPTASLPRPDRAAEAKVAPAKVADTKTADAKVEPVRGADKISETKSAESTARPAPRPADLKAGDKSADDAAKPQVLANWVVRDVYQGVALIEGRRGTLEVVPGVSIPGAGTVKSIDRHGGGWTVTTTKGVVAYGGAPREYRRADRGGYYPGGGYRYDF